MNVAVFDGFAEQWSGPYLGRIKGTSMRRTVFILASCCLAAGLGYAQESHSLVDTLVKHWETSKAFSEAVLEAMPDGGYSYKATEAEMGFGEMANQVADANGHYCSAALGTQSPIAQSTDFSKAAVSKKLAASYDFCIDGLKKLSDQDLMKQAVRPDGNRRSSNCSGEHSRMRLIIADNLKFICA